MNSSLSVVDDVVEVCIFVSYFILSLIIFYLYAKNVRNLKSLRVVFLTILTAMFLMFCALTHLSKVWGGQGNRELTYVCALVSFATAVTALLLRPTFVDMLEKRFRAVELVKDDTIIQLVQGYDLYVTINNNVIVSGRINDKEVTEPTCYTGGTEKGMLLEYRAFKFRIVHKIPLKVSVSGKTDIEHITAPSFVLFGIDETALEEATTRLFHLCLTTAHEIRTPLTSVMSLSNSLYNKWEDNHDTVDELLAHSRVLELLARNLLFSGHLVRGDRLVSPSVEEGNVREIFARMDNTVRFMHGETIAQSFVVEENVPETCLIAVDWFNHTLLNFVMLSLKYTSSGNVDSVCSSDGDFVRLIVTFSGNTHHEEQMPELLQISERGVGVFTIKEMTRTLGGEMSVEHNPQTRRNVFRATFPILDNSEDILADRTRRSNLSDAAANGPESKKILVVDDTSTIHLVMKRALRAHEVEYATNGKEALEMMCEKPYDVIFMDLSMPVMGGLEATIKFREFEKSQNLKKKQVIVMMSATEIDRPDLFDFKLPKPIDHNYLAYILGVK